ncbi:unnamed protein product, partial [Sphacelaria rigidula]
MVIKDDVSNFVWLEPAKSSVEAKKVEQFLTWFKAKAMGSPEVWVDDRGWHVNNCAMRAFNK